MSASAFAGLELLATAVVLLDADLRVVHANSSAENLLATSSRALARQVFCTLFTDAQTLNAKLREAIERAWGFWDQELTLTRQGRASWSSSAPSTSANASSARSAS